MNTQLNNKGNWVRGADRTLTNDKGDKVEFLDNITAIINGERIRGHSAIYNKVQELNKK
jgi:hypothetical protein